MGHPNQYKKHLASLDMKAAKRWPAALTKLKSFKSRDNIFGGSNLLSLKFC